MKETTFDLSRERFEPLAQWAISWRNRAPFEGGHLSFVKDLSKTPQIQNLLSLLQIKTISKPLLVKALIHSSFRNEWIDILPEDNERLEFLGDSVLGAVVTKLIYLDYPQLDEGQLSKLKGALVNEDSLFKLGTSIGLSNCLLVGQGELNKKSYKLATVVSDCFEALLGAIYLDSGFEVTEKTLRLVIAHYDKVNKGQFINLNRLQDFDPKSTLQELTMELFKCLPTYRATQLDEQLFEIEVYINDKCVAKDVGKSKKKTEKKLAKKILDMKLYQA